MLKWIRKGAPNVPVDLGISSPNGVTTLTGLTSADIQTHVTNQSIACWKDGVRVYVWQLAQISDIQPSGNKLIVMSDDGVNVVLSFVSRSECELAQDKFNDAGNGQIV